MSDENVVKFPTGTDKEYNITLTKRNGKVHKFKCDIEPSTSPLSDRLILFNVSDEKYYIVPTDTIETVVVVEVEKE